jgi:GntR family transcriptional regulator
MSSPTDLRVAPADAADFRPLYYRIRQDLATAIGDGRLKPGDAVPSERMLCERYGVSRMTARQALRTLVSDGVLYQVKGIGTFVAHPPLRKALTRLNGFSEDMVQRGYQPSARVLVQEVADAGERVARGLRIAPNDPVFHLRRLRLADDEPLALEDVHLPAQLVSSIVHEDFERESLYDLLATRCRLHLARTEEEIRAVTAGDEDADLLGMARGDPLLVMERLSFTASGVALELGQCSYRADKYSLYVERTRE